jgi:hypothetical protein
MFVRGLGIRDIAAIEGISIFKILSVLINLDCQIVPRQRHYSNLELDEFLTYVGNKNNKLWLIYDYDRANKEIVAYVLGKRNLKTVRKLKQRLSDLGVSYDAIYSDSWNSFVVVFRRNY